MLYRSKVRFLKHPRLNLLWRRWRARRGDAMGSYEHLPEYIRKHAPGKSFADIGCMWGVNGEYSFIAEQAGATSVTAVDVFGPTPEFEEKRKARHSRVRFVLGDITRLDTIDTIGQADVVFCAGVLYHHPSPFDLLVALRRICRETLILRTSTIPEVRGLPNAAVYFPMLNAEARELWNLKSLNAGPLWHSLHAALPTNSFAPRIADGDSAVSSPFMKRSNAEFLSMNLR
jgi:2-polyprenyl-3-methyl-5-hydroxy-6-metoxy-1,4-benzoquinol methylase